jgi:hypothetical protein
VQVNLFRFSLKARNILVPIALFAYHHEIISIWLHPTSKMQQLERNAAQYEQWQIPLSCDLDGYHSVDVRHGGHSVMNNTTKAAYSFVLA